VTYIFSVSCCCGTTWFIRAYMVT